MYSATSQMGDLNIDENIDEAQKKLYTDCLRKQLDEIDMLSSIFCNPGELNIYDPGVISDFNEFILGKQIDLRSQLDFSIFLNISNTKIDVRIDLPHLYPNIEEAIVVVRSTLLSKQREAYVKEQIRKFVDSLDKTESYIFQIVSWLQENLEDFLQFNVDNASLEKNESNKSVLLDFERLWIYSHHIKSKTKRQEIVRLSRELDLTGFSRPGKPGIICVEGLKTNTQEFWKTIKSMHWQKITINKTETKQKTREEFDKCRRFPNFREEILTDIGEEDGAKMDMSLFMKFLDLHNCGYMKKELFGFD